MITLEEINALIEQEREKLKPDTDREYQLQQQIDDTVGKFTVAVDEGNEEEAQHLRDEIKRLKVELEDVEDLNASKDSGAFAAALRSQGKLGKLCKEYEQQQFQIAETMLIDEEKLAAKVTKATEALILAIKDMRAKRQEMASLLQPLDYLKDFIPNPGEYVNGSAYEAFKGRMTQFNFASMGDKVARSGGIF